MMTNLCTFPGYQIFICHDDEAQWPFLLQIMLLLQVSDGHQWALQREA